MSLLLIMLIPLAIPFIAKVIWAHSICWKEFGLHVGAMVILIVICYFAGTYSATYDTETWSGRVIAKKQVKVSCEHSYECNCINVPTGTKGQTTRVCQTCYDHTHDFDWRVFASYDDYMNIRRINDQGTKEPPRWTAVNINDPMSKNVSFTNYIKAAPDSLFNEQAYCTDLPKPEYPGNIYDYYKVDRALSVGGGINPREWSDKISLMMRQLGPEARANFIVVAVNSKDPRYAEDLRQKWLGGKKNDVILVMGFDNKLLQFARVISWSENKMIHVDLRDSVEEAYKGKPVDADGLLAIVEPSIRKNFRRMIEENYEYLSSEIEPPTWVLITSFILGLILSIGLTWYFHRNQTFN